MPKASISSRAERLWQRLSEWYGSRITDQYGQTPPPDWCAVVDRSDNDAVKRALSIIRQHYLEHPPTLPQFEKAFAPPLIGRVEAGPTIQERLCEFVMAHHGRKLTHVNNRRSVQGDDEIALLHACIPSGLVGGVGLLAVGMVAASVVGKRRLPVLVPVAIVEACVEAFATATNADLRFVDGC